MSKKQVVEFKGFLQDKVKAECKCRSIKHLNQARLELCKQLKREIAYNLEAHQTIESLRDKIDLHSGDTCSLNNEVNQVRDDYEDLEMDLRDLQDTIENVLECIRTFGSEDGDQSKQWVLDQVVRRLLGTDEKYHEWIILHNDGTDGPNTYSWDEGTAP